MRRPPARIAAYCVATALVGCAWLPEATGPTYAFRPPNPSNEFPVDGLTEASVGSTAGVAPAGGETSADAAVVTVDDRRPEWERRYRAPVDAPGGWRKAIGFVPAENVEPHPIEALREALRASFAARSPGSQVRLTLRSFRIVINNVDRKRREHEAAEDEAREQADREGANLGGFRVGLVVTNSIGAGPGHEAGVDRRLGGGTPPRRDGPVEPLFMKDYEVVRGERRYFGPPRELPPTYDAGVTCEIVGAVEVLSNQRPASVVSARGATRIVSLSGDGSAEIGGAVSGAITDFVRSASQDGFQR